VKWQLLSILVALPLLGCPTERECLDATVVPTSYSALVCDHITREQARHNCLAAFVKRMDLERSVCNLFEKPVIEED
jgi:hypothetical protein